MKVEVSADSFERWFKDIELVELSEQHLTLRVPNNIYQLWIESNYQGLLQNAVIRAVGSPRRVRFAIAGPRPEVPPAPTSPRPPAEDEEMAPAPRSSEATPAHAMNPRFTFDAFVIGATNQYVQGACKAVAEAPAKIYNPLFIYGAAGLGKTHLLHAIGQHIVAKKKAARVVYVTSESFANEFIDATRNNGFIKFRKRYRQADVLLIDDIQFLAGKSHTSEEFFHTFDTLFDGHKQITLSSDRPPSEIANLESRLVSRFEGGLTAELRAPDTETRLAILRKRAEAMTVNLPPEVLQFLAERIHTSVRRLEGALLRVACYASLNDGSSPNFEKLESLLTDILHDEARRAVTIDQIQRRVAEQFEVRIQDMASRRRPQNIAFARQIAMYLARELTTTSFSEIGEAFGGRDHGTVFHAHRTVKEKVLSDEKTRRIVTLLHSQLSR